jgi:hypothetical protein
MIGRQIAIGFGIAIVIPLLIFYGVSTFSPPPKFQDYYTVAPFNQNATAQEREANLQKQKAGQAAFNDARSKFSSRLFFVSAPLGYAAILAGGFMAVSAVATGMIFGGIFLVINAYLNYWNFIPDWERFLSLVVAAAFLLVIAYRKVPKSD